MHSENIPLGLDKGYIFHLLHITAYWKLIKFVFPMKVFLFS